MLLKIKSVQSWSLIRRKLRMPYHISFYQTNGQLPTEKRPSLHQYNIRRLRGSLTIAPWSRPTWNCHHSCQTLTQHLARWRPQDSVMNPERLHYKCSRRRVGMVQVPLRLVCFWEDSMVSKTRWRRTWSTWESAGSRPARRPREASSWLRKRSVVLKISQRSTTRVPTSMSWAPNLTSAISSATTHLTPRQTNSQTPL